MENVQNIDFGTQHDLVKKESDNMVENKIIYSNENEKNCMEKYIQNYFKVNWLLFFLLSINPFIIGIIDSLILQSAGLWMKSGMEVIYFKLTPLFILKIFIIYTLMGSMIVLVCFYFVNKAYKQHFPKLGQIHIAFVFYEDRLEAPFFEENGVKTYVETIYNQRIKLFVYDQYIYLKTGVLLNKGMVFDKTKFYDDKSDEFIKLIKQINPKNKVIYKKGGKF